MRMLGAGYLHVPDPPSQLMAHRPPPRIFKPLPQDMQCAWYQDQGEQDTFRLSPTRYTVVLPAQGSDGCFHALLWRCSRCCELTLLSASGSRSLPGWRESSDCRTWRRSLVGPGGQAAGDRELVLGRQWWVRVMLVSPMSLDIAYETKSKIKLRESKQQSQSVQALLSMAYAGHMASIRGLTYGNGIAPTITGGCDGALDLWILMLLRLL